MATKSDYILASMLHGFPKLIADTEAVVREAKARRRRGLLGPADRRALKRLLQVLEGAEGSLRRVVATASPRPARTRWTKRQLLAAHEAALGLAGAPTEQDSPYITPVAERQHYRRVHNNNPRLMSAEQVRREVRAFYRDGAGSSPASTRQWTANEREVEAGEARAAAQYRRLGLGKK